jgi:hypothetical protein
VLLVGFVCWFVCLLVGWFSIIKNVIIKKQIKNIDENKNRVVIMLTKNHNIIYYKITLFFFIK